MDNSTYTLIVPIKRGEETITELHLERPKLKHFRKLDTIIGDMSKTAKVIELLANIPPSVVDELSLKDVQEIDLLIKTFL